MAAILDIKYHALSWDEENPLIKGYLKSRHAAFSAIWPNTIYKPNEGLEKDKSPYNVFFVAVDNKINEVVGGAILYTKPSGSDKNLPLFNYFEDSDYFPHKDIKPTDKLGFFFSEENIGNLEAAKYKESYLAETGGAFRLSEIRDTSYRGMGIYDRLVDLRFKYANEIGIDIIFSELTAKNKSAFPSRMLLNQEEWDGYDFPKLQDKLVYSGDSFNDAGKRVVAMINPSFVVKAGLDLESMCENKGGRETPCMRSCLSFVKLKQDVFQAKDPVQETAIVS